MSGKPGENRGVKNFKAKLTEDDVIFIYLCENMKQEELAAKFNVTQSTINHIKRARTWKWLTNKYR
jgi:predicted XRE-type DNA-binding protein